MAVDAKRNRRHRRIRARLSGDSLRPRVSIFRSNKALYAQVIDDTMHSTIVAGVTASVNGTKVAQSETLGKELAKLLLEKGIKSVVFDRSGYAYHGRVKAIAQGMREGGLEF